VKSGPPHAKPAEDPTAFPPLPSSEVPIHHPHAGSKLQQPSHAEHPQPAEGKTQMPPLPASPSSPAERHLPSINNAKQPSPDSKQQQQQQGPAAQEKPKPAKQQEDADLWDEAWFAGDQTCPISLGCPLVCFPPP
jgi:hypothetical protein